MSGIAVRGTPTTGKFDRYVPRVVLRRLVAAPEDLVETLEGTIVFVDVSGFTRLSERLARKGREGAEHLTDAINACFSALLADAYANGGSLLKFGGDALLLWFEGDDHPLRACSSAVAMRATLRRAGRVRAAGSEIVLRMSAGVHSGSFQMFLLGTSHREFLIAGPDSTKAVEMEALASAGQVLLSPQTAARLPRRALGAEVGPGVLLARSPSTRDFAPEEGSYRPEDDAIIGCLSTEVRAHVLAAPAAPEHRTAIVAFAQFGGLDDLIKARGASRAARALRELVDAVEAAADLFQVCFLGSDVAAGGGKLILTAGAPRAVGDDEERMLLTLRHIVEQPSDLPIRIGVNRGRVFAGEIGPHYRRTYSVMGDTVNLAARLMAAAPWESVYATEGVLTRSQTKFELTRLEAFTVKGKSQPIEAWAVGALARPGAKPDATNRVPLIGRDTEHATLRDALLHAERGDGALIEVIGETGSGKSRLLAEVHELADGFRFAHTICENYRRSVPYVVWRDILRQLLGLRWEAPDEVVAAAIRHELQVSNRGLLPWLPLLAIVFDFQEPMTREVSDLGLDHRSAKLHEVLLEFLGPWLAVPTLLEIEHTHFMDEASAALLRAIGRQLESSAWVIAVTRRDVVGGFVGTDEFSTRLELGPLPANAMMALAESTPQASRVPPHVIELAVERAGGSPEFLLDLLEAAADGSGELPDSVDAAASARIDELDPRDRVLVRRASVLGLCFHRRLLRYVLDDGVPEPDDQTWSRIDSVFADDGEGYKRFRRPAMCEVAYEGLPFRLRRELHAAVGEALEPDLGRDADADPAVLSLHFILAGDHQRAWRYARMGAERAGARFAHADAARLYQRAIEAGREGHVSDTEMAGVWEALGEARRLTGEPKAALKALSSARRLLPDDPLAEARLCYRQADITERYGRLTAAVRWLRRGLRRLDGIESKQASVWRARIIANLGAIRIAQGHVAEAIELSQQAIVTAESIGELRALARACYMLDWALSEAGRREDAVHSQRSLEIYAQLGDPEREARVVMNLGAFAYEDGRWDDAVTLYRRAAELGTRAGNPDVTATSEVNIGEILSDQGRLGEAGESLNRAGRVYKSIGQMQGVAFVTMLLGRLAVREERYSEGRSLLETASLELARLSMDYYVAVAKGYLAEAEAFGGDARGALELADRMLATTDRNLALVRRVRAIALIRLGRTRAAIDELEASLSAADGHGTEYDVAAALDLLDALGVVADGAAQRDEILGRLQVQRLYRPPTIGTPSDLEVSTALVS